MPNRRAHIVQFGVGGVGKALLEQVLSTREHLLDRRGLRLDYLGLVDSAGYLLCEDTLGDDDLRRALLSKARGQPLSDLARGKARDEGDDDAILAWLQNNEVEDVIVVDSSAAQGMERLLLKAVSAGYGIVLATKRPLVASMDTFHALQKGDRLRHEATVGAGLPIIHTIRYLLDTGDSIASINGCLSGTMGYLCAQMEECVPFSTALAQAKLMGYTEPDPREDLGGLDVARKALILARLLGWELELDEVSVEPLYPADWDRLPVSDFLEAAEQLNTQFAAQVTQAQARGEVLRYVAEVKDRACRVGLRTVPTNTLMGSLKGTDNIVTIHSSRYDRPLIVCGAGAGVEVTAAAVLEDVVDLAMTWRRPD